MPQIKGADFEKQTAKLSKEEPVAVYCRSGAGSKAATRKFAVQDYTVYELDKGIMSWPGKTEK